MHKKNTFLKGGLVVVGAIAVSSLGLFASDSLQGIDRSLTGLVGDGAGTICPAGMALVKDGDTSFCADMYEASAGEDCIHTEPGNILETSENISATSCIVESKKGSVPWRFVSLTQAQTLCAASGKRLPTNNEWYKLALGTRSDSCVLDSTGSPRPTGSAECISAANVHDAIGNVWEWVNETVTDAQYANRTLPDTGYVASVDASGVAITAQETEQPIYGEDYFWSKAAGTFGMIRGGFYGSGDDGGIFSINATVETSFSSPGVGFRCVQDV